MRGHIISSSPLKNKALLTKNRICKSFIGITLAVLEIGDARYREKSL